MGLTSLNLGGGYLYANAIPAYNFGTSDFTVEGWVKTLTGGTIVGKKSTDGGSGNGGFLLVARPDGTIKFATDNGSGFYEVDSVPSPVCDGIWHHVAAVRQGSTISLYLDGRPLSGSPRGNAAPPLNVSNNYRLTIGTVDQQQEPYRTLAGAVAEVRLWSRARTATEIAAAYSTRLPPGTPELAGYWSAEQGLLADFSGNNSTAQISGMVMASTDAPAVGPGNSAAMLFLFGGIYDCAIKYGGTSGTWNPSAQLYITSMGFVVQNNHVMSNVSILGNSITWPAQGNPCTGNLNFALDSTNAYFWPTGQSRHNFTGSTQSGSSGAVDYRGVLMPTRTGCGVFLSVGTGQIFYTPNPAAGTPVALAPKTAQVSEHYCVYDTNQILHMATGLALTAKGGLVAGSTIVLAQPDSSATTQQWVLGDNGTITADGAPNLAMAVNLSQQPNQLVLASLNAADPNQQFVTLTAQQFIFNANVTLVIAGNTQVTVQTKADDAPSELWYVVQNSLLNAVNAQALAVDGAAVPGASLKLATFNPSDAAQSFVSQNGQLIHEASGLPVKMSAVGAGLTLGNAGETGSNLGWTIAATTPAVSDGTGPQVTERAVTAQATPATVDYIIEVWTSPDWFAGTDDKVEVSLVSTTMSSIFVELKDSLTSSDPFERGCIDQFKVTLPNLGKLVAVNIRYGGNNWFFNDSWGLDKIYVYDPTTITRYATGYIGDGSTYWVPSKAHLTFISAYVIGSINSTMSIGKAPTQDNVTRGWADHTWAQVVADENSQTTYFDCGGSNNGPGTTPNIISSKCSIDTAVKMATGYYIDSAHPYQPVYGHDDVTGQQTCGIVASGWLGWGGQCHQMVNRLLYICNPPVALESLPWLSQPWGYGFTVCMFGKYGVQFDQWCQINGFPAPPDRNNSIYSYIRRYVAGTKHQTSVYYAAVAMQASPPSDANTIQGPAAHAFFQYAKAAGVPDDEMCKLTNLSEDEVVEEQQPYVAPSANP